MYPKNFERLIESFSKLPGVGKKTAERYAFATLNWESEWIDEFSTSLLSIRDGIKRCKVCGNLSDGDICGICSDRNRNQKIICVVQSPKEVITIENMQEYNGVYHVLNGCINVQKGILPENLNIDNLLKRIDGSIEEVILACDPTVEGETTALYIAKLLEGKVKVTRLAHGIPMGSHVDYTDSHTLMKAFEGRK